MDDRVVGALILIGSILGILAYFWLIFFSPWIVLTMQLTAFMAVTAVLVILAWIGYTLATTPPPQPIEEIERELEEELKEMEEESAEISEEMDG
jgi:predicted DNA-binding transcriptional regulator